MLIKSLKEFASRYLREKSAQSSRSGVTTGEFGNSQFIEFYDKRGIQQ